MAELLDSLAGRTRFRIPFEQYLVALCSRPEVTCDVILGVFVGRVVPGNHVKFGNPRLKLSREIPPEAL